MTQNPNCKIVLDLSSVELENLMKNLLLFDDKLNTRISVSKKKLKLVQLNDTNTCLYASAIELVDEQMNCSEYHTQVNHKTLRKILCNFNEKSNLKIVIKFYNDEIEFEKDTDTIFESVLCKCSCPTQIHSFEAISYDRIHVMDTNTTNITQLLGCRCDYSARKFVNLHSDISGLTLNMQNEHFNTAMKFKVETNSHGNNADIFDFNCEINEFARVFASFNGQVRLLLGKDKPVTLQNVNGRVKTVILMSPYLT